METPGARVPGLPEVWSGAGPFCKDHATPEVRSRELLGVDTEGDARHLDKPLIRRVIWGEAFSEPATSEVGSTRTVRPAADQTQAMQAGELRYAVRVAPERVEKRKMSHVNESRARMWRRGNATVELVARVEIKEAA